MKKKDCGCKDKVKMSTPEGMKFHSPYEIPTEKLKEQINKNQEKLKNNMIDTLYETDHTFHNKYYWDTNRNGRIDVEISEGESYIVSFDKQLDDVIKKITDLLKEKNKAYGNTALNPPKIFSKLNATEAICARLDDKISRIQNKGINDETEDTVDDLIGYLLLLKMSLS